jgi:hypothetical protein
MMTRCEAIKYFSLKKWEGMTAGEIIRAGTPFLWTGLYQIQDREWLKKNLDLPGPLVTYRLNRRCSSNKNATLTKKEIEDFYASHDPFYVRRFKKI